MPYPEGMQLAWEDKDGARWIRLEGELDHPACHAIRESFKGAVDGAPGDVVVAMDRVDFLSSMAVGLLLKARETLHGHGRRLRLAGLQPGPRRALQMMSVGHVFDEA